MSASLPSEEAAVEPLFFFGTLMDPDILGLVIGRNVAAEELEPAVLRGFRRVRVRGASYPMLVADASGRVEGVLWRGVRAADRLRLDAYEGAGYRRTAINVETRTGETVRAQVYCAVPGQLTPTDEEWDLGVWRKRFKSEYVRFGKSLWRAYPP